MTISTVEWNSFESLVRKIDPDGKLRRVWKLTGGVSALVTGLEVEQADGQITKMIVRQHGQVDLAFNPNVAVDEFKLLRHLSDAGLAVPQPYYVESSGEIFGTPCIVVEYIEGATEFAPADVMDFCRQLAQHLSRIHQVAEANTALSFLPTFGTSFGERPAVLDESIDEGRIRDALEAVVALALNAPVLLHGDYWPGNVMCREGQIVAVIDWEDAMLGDPLVDMGRSRLEILWAFGAEAMQAYTAHYQALMTDVDYTDLPYWDLRAALRPAFKIGEWAGDADRENVMRERHGWFVSQALGKLSVQGNE